MGLASWTEQAINFAVFVILARLLGVEAFGLLALAAALVVLAEVLVRESLSEFLISEASPGAGHYDAAFWSLTILGAGLAAALYGIAPLVAIFYG